MAKRWVIGGLAVGVGALVLAPEARTWLRRRLGLEPEDRRWFEEEGVETAEHEGDEPLDTREARFSLRARLAEEGHAEPAEAAAPPPRARRPRPRRSRPRSRRPPAPAPPPPRVRAAAPARRPRREPLRARRPSPPPRSPPPGSPPPRSRRRRARARAAPRLALRRPAGGRAELRVVEPCRRSRPRPTSPRRPARTPTRSSRCRPTQRERRRRADEPADEDPAARRRHAAAAAPPPAPRPFSGEGASFRSAIDAARERVHGAAREATPDDGRDTEPLDERS